MNLIRSLLVFALFSPFLLNAQLPEGFVRELLAVGLDPTGLSIAPDGRVFIVEKRGRIRILEGDRLLEAPFLELEVDNENERGLQSMVLHPDFEFNNYFYVFYTVPGEGRNRISRFTANGNATLAGSEEVIFELDPLSGTVHNGGGMHISKSGHLMVSVGDGSTGRDAGDLNSLNGKFLRLNLDGSIPEDNPFFDQLEGQYRAIYAYGFRNSYGWSIDPVKGTILANDVGASLWEEINRIEKGKFYGWNEIEGPRADNEVTENYEDPLYAYDHGQGCAITLSTFYYGPPGSFPDRYQGKYLFGDYCQGTIWVLDPESGQVEETYMTGLDRPVSGLVGPDGALYYLLRPKVEGTVGADDNTATAVGELWRVRYVGDGKPFIGRQPESRLVPVGESARFELEASGTPPLSYEWWVHDTVVKGVDAPLLTLSEVTLDQDQTRIFCRVYNGRGEQHSDTVLLRVTSNQRPVLEMVEPLAGSTYRAGDILYFRGDAADPEDGKLDSRQMSWRIDFHHNDHTHPAMGNRPGIREGYYEIPVVGEIDTNVWYRVHFSASDQEGLTSSTYKDLFPEITQYELHTRPQGMELITDVGKKTGPVKLASVQGILRSVEVPEFQFRGDTIYYFSHWSRAEAENAYFIFEAGRFDSATAFFGHVIPQFAEGEGLLGTYYNHVWEEDPFTEQVLERIDPVIGFDWDTRSPVPGQINKDNFSVRWTGSLEPTVSGLHRFHMTSDGNFRLWVNGQLIIDRWEIGENRSAEVKGEIELDLGERYPVVLEYQHNWWIARIELLWSSPFFPKVQVPKSQLFPDLVPVVTSVQDEFDSVFSMNLFPNPGGGYSPTLRVNHVRREYVEWECRDTQGRLLESGKALLSRGENLIPVPIGEFPSGVYFITLKSLDHGWAKMGRWVRL